jgi:cobalt/nickel transport system permease protein
MSGVVMAAADHLAHGGRWRAIPLAEKALLALGLLALAVSLPPFPGAAVVLATALVATWGGARVPVAAWLRLAAAPMAFIVTGAAAMLVGWQDGLVWASPALALATALRSLAAVACLLLLATTTPAPDLIQGLRRIGLPEELADVALATYRFLFVLSDTAAAMHAGQAARLGQDGMGRRLRSLGLLAAALLPRALERAHRLEIGLAARGFDGALPVLVTRHPISVGRVAGIVATLATVAGGSLWLG